MNLLEELIPIAREAGAALLDVYATDFDVRGKSDTSPVTAADERAGAVILERLAKLTPDIPIVSEEATSRGSIPATGRSFWLVDPLDGTKEFINRVVSSRSHGDAEALERFLAGRPVASSVSAGSSLKFCLVAKGEADLYPRFGRTMEWDTAAGHAVLLAAEGEVGPGGEATRLWKARL